MQGKRRDLSWLTMRSAVKRRQDAYEHQSCEKSGIDVYEYKILEKRNAALEVEFTALPMSGWKVRKVPC